MPRDKNIIEMDEVMEALPIVAQNNNQSFFQRVLEYFLESRIFPWIAPILIGAPSYMGFAEVEEEARALPMPENDCLEKLKEAVDNGDFIELKRILVSNNVKDEIIDKELLDAVIKGGNTKLLNELMNYRFNSEIFDGWQSVVQCRFEDDEKEIDGSCILDERVSDENPDADIEPFYVRNILIKAAKYGALNIFREYIGDERLKSSDMTDFMGFAVASGSVEICELIEVDERTSLQTAPSQLVLGNGLRQAITDGHTDVVEHCVQQNIASKETINRFKLKEVAEEKDRTGEIGRILNGEPKRSYQEMINDGDGLVKVIQ